MIIKNVFAQYVEKISRHDKRKHRTHLRTASTLEKRKISVEDGGSVVGAINPSRKCRCILMSLTSTNI